MCPNSKCKIVVCRCGWYLYLISLPYDATYFLKHISSPAAKHPLIHCLNIFWTMVIMARDFGLMRQLNLAPKIMVFVSECICKQQSVIFTGFFLCNWPFSQPRTCFVLNDTLPASANVVIRFFDFALEMIHISNQELSEDIWAQDREDQMTQHNMRQ